MEKLIDSEKVYGDFKQGKRSQSIHRDIFMKFASAKQHRCRGTKKSPNWQMVCDVTTMFMPRFIYLVLQQQALQKPSELCINFVLVTFSQSAAELYTLESISARVQCVWYILLSPFDGMFGFCGIFQNSSIGLKNWIKFNKTLKSAVQHSMKTAQNLSTKLNLPKTIHPKPHIPSYAKWIAMK